MSKSGYLKLSTETAATITGGEAVMSIVGGGVIDRNTGEYLGKHAPVIIACPGPEPITLSAYVRQ